VQDGRKHYAGIIDLEESKDCIGPIRAAKIKTFQPN
jgi:hypothetical protein